MNPQPMEAPPPAPASPEEQPGEPPELSTERSGEPEPLLGTMAEKKSSREWIRKAASRRFTANCHRKAGDAAEAAGTDYAPQFTARQEADWTPEFDTPRTSPESAPTGPAVEWTWLSTAALAVTGGLAVATMLLLPRSGEIQGKSRLSGTDLTLRQAVSRIPEARRTVARFFTATTPEEKTAFIRGGARLLPALTAYYRTHPDEPTGFTLANNVDFIPGADGNFIIVSGTTGDGFPFDTAVELSPDGPRLDWRYLTGEGDMAWAGWISECPPRPVLLRGIGLLDDYYAGTYADAERWICLRVTDIDRSTTVWAYAERKGPLLAPLLLLSGMTVPVRIQGVFEFTNVKTPGTIEISIPQVLLHRLLDNGWLDHSSEVLSPGAP